MGDAGPGKAGADFDGKKAMKKAKKPGGRLDQYPEQQFIMRVRDKGLARRIRAVLDPAHSAKANDNADLEMDLRFETSDEGKFVIGNDEYDVSLRPLPTVVESYKTLNDVDLVKSGDIGQILVVRPRGSKPPPQGEYRDGLTPPMRRARERLFRDLPKVEDKELVQDIEKALVRLLAGGAPENVTITDYEEEWDEQEQRWVPASGKKKKGRAAPAVKIKKEQKEEVVEEDEGVAEVDEMLDGSDDGDGMDD